jgi:Ca2+-binding EF-hand superfamily protein
MPAEEIKNLIVRYCLDQSGMIKFTRFFIKHPLIISEMHNL